MSYVIIAREDDWEPEVYPVLVVGSKEEADEAIRRFESMDSDIQRRLNDIEQPEDWTDDREVGRFKSDRENVLKSNSLYSYLPEHAGVTSWRFGYLDVSTEMPEYVQGDE